MVLKNTVLFLSYKVTSLFLAGSLLGQQLGVDVGQHSSGGDGHSSQESVQLLVVSDSQLDVARNDAGSLVVAGSVSGQLQDLGSQVLQHGGQVHGGSGSDAVSVSALTQVTVDTSDGELQTSSVSSGGRLASLLSFSFSSFSS